MAENRCSCNSGGASSGGRETVCIDTYRVLDSCRDKDCYENARVYLSCAGQELINRLNGGVRVVCAKLLWTYISVEPIQFNRGFYQIGARFYVQLRFEACVGGGRSQEFFGITVLEKKVVLYGGEGSVNIYRSIPGADFCNPWQGSARSTNLPIGVIEAVEPVVLGLKIEEPCNECNSTCYCACACEDIPCDLLDQNGLEALVDPEGGSRLYVSLGLFSVFRIERPAQYLVSGTEYCVPEKQCVGNEPDNPCALFRSMAFPSGEFSGGCNTQKDCNKGCH